MSYPKHTYTLEDYYRIVEAHPDHDFTYDSGKIWLMTGLTIDHPTHSAVRRNIANSLTSINREKYRDAILKAYDEKQYDVMYKIIAERDQYQRFVFENKSHKNLYGPDGPEEPLLYIPDVLVTTKDPNDREIWVRDETFEEAVLLVDIFCEAGERSKKQEKLAAYQSSQRYKNLQEILVVDPHRTFLEHFRQDDTKQWEAFSYTQDEQVIELVSVQLRLPVRDIYYQVLPA